MSTPDPRQATGPSFISEVTRHAIVDELLLRDEPYYGRRLNEVAFLNRFLPLNSLPATDRRFRTLYEDLVQHVVNNNDYSDIDVLSGFAKVHSCPDLLFGRFLEECLHPLVRDDAEARAELLEMFNKHLKADGFELAQGGSISGRPIFKLKALAQPGPVASVVPLDVARAFYDQVPDVLKTSSPDIPQAAKIPDPLSSITVASADTYDVVLSYASEQRGYVEAVAAALNARGVRYFYDAEHTAYLWGKDLNETLGKIYGGNAKFCVMFISEAYSRKDWPIVERRNALMRAVRDRAEYILPVRFDETMLDGLPQSVVYVSSVDFDPHQLADMVVQKLHQVGLA
jgi:hypothetical protein